MFLYGLFDDDDEFLCQIEAGGCKPLSPCSLFFAAVGDAVAVVKHLCLEVCGHQYDISMAVSAGTPTAKYTKSDARLELTTFAFRVKAKQTLDEFSAAVDQNKKVCLYELIGPTPLVPACIKCKSAQQ